MKMVPTIPSGLHEVRTFREKRWVFRNRSHAGEILADMLKPYRNNIDWILGIPAGGVPVAAVVAEKLSLPLDVAIVSKITLPWNTESGYGAIAFDGTHQLNERLLSRLNLTDSDIEAGIKKTTEKVNRRVSLMRGVRPFPDIQNRFVVLIDDGLASGFTMKVSIDALIKLNAGRIMVAVPTAHKESIDLIQNDVHALFCPNIRSGFRYAVAEAYQDWCDVEEAEALEILKRSF